MNKNNTNNTGNVNNTGTANNRNSNTGNANNRNANNRNSKKNNTGAVNNRNSNTNNTGNVNNRNSKKNNTGEVKNNLSSKKYNINNKVGILDPNGNKENPLTRKEYTNLNSYKALSEKWQTFPVYEKKDEILKCMKENNVTIAKSGTGSGKTVLFPKLMLHVLGYSKPVVCTVPKRLLAQSSAEFAAACLDVKVGEHVGYYYKGKKKNE